MRNVELRLLFCESSLSDTEPILQINFDHFLTENFNENLKTWTTRTPLEKHTKDGISDDLDSKLNKWPVQTFQATMGINMVFYLIPWLHHHKIKSKGKGRRRSNSVASVMQKICWCNCKFEVYLLVFLIYCNPMFILRCYYVMSWPYVPIGNIYNVNKSCQVIVGNPHIV